MVPRTISWACEYVTTKELKNKTLVNSAKVDISQVVKVGQADMVSTICCNGANFPVAHLSARCGPWKHPPPTHLVIIKLRLLRLECCKFYHYS